MYAAIDIGGTKTLIAVFEADGSIIEQVKFPTAPNYEDFLKDLENNVVGLSTKEFAYGAVGIRGRVDRIKGVLLSDNILAWRDATVGADCAAIFGCVFSVENDSKLAGLSEARLLGDKFRKVLYLTISTGIGSAYVVDGVIDPMVADSEIGKTLYEHDGNIQHWEDFASGKAIVEKFGKRASEIEDPETWRAISKNLAPGIINATAVYTPDVIIIGGGVGSHYHKFEKELIETINDLEHNGINVPPIYQAKRPEEAVVYGCYELAKQNSTDR